jgi:hypothetical protein
LWCEWQQAPPQQEPPLQQSAFGEANEAPMVNAIRAATAKLVKSFFMTILLFDFSSSQFSSSQFRVDQAG